jgi:hypothetical protein
MSRPGPGTGEVDAWSMLIGFGQVLLVDDERFALELVEGLLDAVGDRLSDLLLFNRMAWE